MSLKYRPEIDGLRAIAVVPVILFHAGFSIFGGGFTGVDVFFVISGYLISSIVYGQLEGGSFSLLTFYEKRARRLMPMLFTVMLASVVVSWFALTQTDMIDFLESLIAVSFFASNILFVVEAGYFDTAVELKPLLHTWSLAVEEQFYLFFPPILWLFFRWTRQRMLISFLTVVALMSFILSEWASQTYPTFGFYLLPTRSWELSVGAIIGVLNVQKNEKWKRIQSHEFFSRFGAAAGLILVLLGIFLIDEGTPFPGRFALFPVIGTACIISFAHQNEWVGKALSSRVLVIIGLTSYSSYLWHQPLFAFVSHIALRDLLPEEKGLLIIAVLSLSWLTWKYIETPFRKPTWISKKGIFRMFFAGTALFLSIGMFGLFQKGFPGRYICERLRIGDYEADNRKLKLLSWEPIETLTGGTTYDWFSLRDQRKNLLIIGNSHSKDLYNVLESSDTAKKYFQIGRENVQFSGLGKNPNTLLASNNYIQADVIMFAARYYHNDIMKEDDLPYLLPLVLQMRQDGKKVVLVKEIYNFKLIGSKTASDVLVEAEVRKGRLRKEIRSYPWIVSKSDSLYYHNYRSESSTLRKDASDAELKSISNQADGVVLLDRMDYVCDDIAMKCFSLDSTLNKYFYDYGHHTLEGAEFFGNRVDQTNWLAPVIEAVGAK